MKKKTIKTLFFTAILAIVLCFSCCANTSLKEIAKPYLGEYQCKSATLGEKDMLSAFEYIKLELNPDNTFVIRYKTRLGQAGEEWGNYTYSPDTQSIRFFGGEKGELKRDFSLKEGKIDVSIPIADKQLHVQFARK